MPSSLFNLRISTQANPLCFAALMAVCEFLFKSTFVYTMIRVNTKEDERIAETFPNDPYSNLCIITATQKLNLQQAFLSMDSEYFSKIDPDTRQIDLRELKEEPLIRVIHSLYGAQLVLNSVAELREIYPIILYLGIEDYKQNILQEVGERKEVLESVEFIELSFKHGLWWEKVLELHMQNRLRLLEDSRNYLQLSKIEADTFNVLIQQFWTRYGQAECKVLNNVLENYFNRNNHKPLVYLKANLPKLLPLWLKYHHISATEMITLKSTPHIALEEETRSRKRTEQLHRRNMQEDVEAKRRKVAELENEIYFKDSMIRELTAQIEQTKRDLGLASEQKEVTAQSLLINVGSIETITPLMKKKKRLAEMSPEIQSDNEGEKEEKRKASIEPKDPKGTMHRLGSKNIKKL